MVHTDTHSLVQFGLHVCVYIKITTFQWNVL